MHKKESKQNKNSKNYRPAVRDFSQKSIKKALLKKTAEHWSFQYPVVGFLASIMCGAILGVGEIVYIAFFTTFGASCFSWIYNYFIKSDDFKLKYVENLQREIEEETQAKRLQLAEDLSAQNCKRGVKQLLQLQADFDSLVELLGTMLNTEEITYKRYHGIALEVYLSGIDNLKKVLTALMSVSEINENEIHEIIAGLEKKSGTENEINALKERLKIKERQMEKVKDLLQQNTVAITQLEKTAAMITNLNTGLDEGKIDMESSMDDLGRIVTQAKKRLEMITLSKS